jgi:hypothetical protein
MKAATPLLAVALAVSASAFTPNRAPSAIRKFRGLTSPLNAKAPADSEDAVVEVRLEAVGSVCEFDDGKHTDRILLGVVRGASSKAKGGTVYQLEDADGKTHSVAGKSIHVVFAPSSGKEKDTAKLLADYLTVSTTAPTDLGIEPEVLEMAWELCSETEAKDFSPKSILSVIDESLYKTSVDQYKAFRLLTSDLGKVFFKTLSGNRFKAKAEKAVAASKEQWCNQLAQGGGDDEWCFV